VKKDEIKQAFVTIHGLDMKGIAMLMVGMPGETVEDFKLTKRLLREIKADGFYFSMFLPSPGTEFFEIAKQHGFKEPTTLDEWARLGGLDFTSYPQRSLSEVPWPMVKKLIDKEYKSARYRAYWKAFKRDPIGATVRVVKGQPKGSERKTV